MPAFSDSVPAQHRTVYPFGTYMLHGLAALGPGLLSIDAVRGYLLKINPLNDDTLILNPHHLDMFRDAGGVCLQDEMLWFTRDRWVYRCRVGDFTPELFVELDYPADGVAVCGSTVYISSQRLGYILVYSRETREYITRFYAPGVGPERMTLRGDELWVCDRTEQTVYCLDRATGDILFSAITPFEHPTGLAFWPHPETGEELLMVAYATEEVYVRDDPNTDPPHTLTTRDRTFIHPLHFWRDPQGQYTLSNGYLVEMSYVEELSPLEALHLSDLEWRITLPADTPRQKVISVEPVGYPFEIEEHPSGQRIAIFRFGELQPHEGRIFGWRAQLEVRGIKYQFTPEDVENPPELSADFQARYLIDDDELAMDTTTIQEAARTAIRNETNLLRKVISIRDYVYDRLDYAIKPHIDTPDVVLERGTGSCGEYVGILLALMRLNGIACRTVGRYKCPKVGAYQHHLPLEPDFNHVWIEFFLPGFGWVPMESNPDDLTDSFHYPTRFFMGLAWYHAEIAKDISFERVTTKGTPIKELPEPISIGDLALNHIRFTVLRELPPLVQE